MIYKVAQKMRLVLPLLLIMLMTVGIKAQSKQALIVAIGSYGHETGWSKINSTNDIPLIQEVLAKQGFKTEDIHLLSDEEATKTGILDAFERYLIESVKFGDVAYFHFSGHGQQVMDTNNDEIDGYDEAIVPYDASTRFETGVYEGKNHLIDDELNELYSRLRRKLGKEGHFLVTVDACHSGTSTRALGIARGTEQPMAPQDYIDGQSSRGEDQSQLIQDGQNTESMASMIAFFGAMPHQLNYEVKGEDGRLYGALSYAFSRAISTIGTGASYRQLFDRMRFILNTKASNQIPEAEGILDQDIMGGSFLGKPNYYSVEKWIDERQLSIDGGFLQGLTAGSVVEFYPPETRDNKGKNSIAKGRISTARATTSSILLDEPANQKLIETAWVFVTEENFGDLIIQLQVDAEMLSKNKIFFDKLFSMPYIKAVDHGADLILLNENSQLLLIMPNDVKLSVYADKLSDLVILDKIKDDIRRYGQAEYLRKLEQENIHIPLEFEFIPVDYDIQNAVETGRYSIDSKTDRSGIIRFKVGDIIKIKVTNQGTRPAYFTLLDIQPDNYINVLFPGPNESSADYKLMPGKSIELKRPIQIGPPFGQELFKLIASRKPIDLRSIEQTRGKPNTEGTSLSPFEILFSQSFYNDELQSRGGKTIGLPSGQVNIYSSPFIIE